MLFSVAKRTTGGFSRIYRPGRRGRDEKRVEEGEGGRERKRGEEECVGQIEENIKSRSSINQVNRNQLNRTGDGIASLKI